MENTVPDVYDWLLCTAVGAGLDRRDPRPVAAGGGRRRRRGSGGLWPGAAQVARRDSQLVRCS